MFIVYLVAMLLLLFVVFFFKQKTAYEMRISDWSSDVCSSDLGLTQGCFEAIAANGTDEQKNTYLPKLATGEWSGTMCMTEPQAGSDLAAVKTKAHPQDDGSFLLEGSKIFITSGEHEMAGNIIHFTPARLPDSPPGQIGTAAGRERGWQ